MSGDGEFVRVVMPAVRVIVSGDVVPKSTTAACAPPRPASMVAARAALPNALRIFISPLLTAELTAHRHRHSARLQPPLIAALTLRKRQPGELSMASPRSLPRHGRAALFGREKSLTGARGKTDGPHCVDSAFEEAIRALARPIGHRRTGWASAAGRRARAS